MLYYIVLYCIIYIYIKYYIAMHKKYIRLYHIKMKPYYTYLSVKEFELIFLIASNYDTGFHNSDLTPPKKKKM